MNRERLLEGLYQYGWIFLIFFSFEVMASSGITTLQTRRLFLYDGQTPTPNSLLLQTPSSLSNSYALTFPPDDGDSGQVLSTDGSGVLSWINPSTGSVTGVSGTSPIQVTGTTSAVVSVDDATESAKGVVKLAPDGDTTAGLVVQANDSRLSDSRTPSGTAGGDLSGTYPNPTVTKIQNTAVDSTAPTAAGHVLRYDGSKYSPSFIDIRDIRSSVSGLGGTPTFPTVCTNSQTLTWSALTNVFTCSGISIASTEVTGLGTAAAKDFGTDGGDLVELDSGGKIPSALLPSSSQWTTTGSNIYYNTGNVGPIPTLPLAR